LQWIIPFIRIDSFHHFPAEEEKKQFTERCKQRFSSVKDKKPYRCSPERKEKKTANDISVAAQV
jgi:hypothetical protein